MRHPAEGLQLWGVSLLKGSGVAFAGSGTLGNLPSEGVYEDIGVVPLGDKDEGLRASGAPVLEEEYDDAEEPGLDPEEGEAEEGPPALCRWAPLRLGIHGASPAVPLLHPGLSSGCAYT